MGEIRILLISESTGVFCIESGWFVKFGFISSFLLGVFTVLNCVVLPEKRILRVGIGGSSNPGCGFLFLFFFIFFLIGVFFVFLFFKRGKDSVYFFYQHWSGGTGRKKPAEGGFSTVSVHFGG